MDNRQTIIDDFESIIVLALTRIDIDCLATPKFKEHKRNVCSLFSAHLKASLTPGASIATNARVINSPVRVFLLNYRRAIDIAC